MASTVQEPTAHKPAPRIHLAPLAKRLALALVIPVLLALIADQLLGTAPWLMLAVALVCIPLATVLVSKAALRDLDRVIAEVAPPMPEPPVEEGVRPAVTEPSAGEIPADRQPTFLTQSEAR